MKLKLFTVILLYPDYASVQYGETSKTLVVEARNPAGASEVAKQLCAGEDPRIRDKDDLLVISVFKGKHEDLTITNGPEDEEPAVDYEKLLRDTLEYMEIHHGDYLRTKLFIATQRSQLRPSTVVDNSDRDPLLLTDADWMEIYYSLDSKKRAASTDGDKVWRAHLESIMDVIGVDGETAAKRGIAPGDRHSR